jgi:DNA-binding XRE family transcriptional regulator
MATSLQVKRTPHRLTDEQVKAFNALGRRIDAEEGEAIRARARAMFKRHDATRALVARLKARRIEKGLSLADVAARMGIAKPNLSRLENSRNASPTLETLHRYAKAVGMTVRVELKRVRRRFDA